MITIPSNYTFDLQEFVEYLEKQRTDVLEKLIAIFQDMLRYIIVVYEGFESNMHQVDTSKKMMIVIVIIIKIKIIQ